MRFSFYRVTGVIILCLHLLTGTQASLSLSPEAQDSITFPVLIEEFKNGTKISLLSLKRIDHRELTGHSFVGIFRERRWLGADDIFLEYELMEESPTYQKVSSRHLVWFIPDEKEKTLVALLNFPDDEQQNSSWLRLGPLRELRTFQYLLSIYEKTNHFETYAPEPPSFPILFDTDSNNNKSWLYQLEKKTHTAGSIMRLHTGRRETLPDDLFLEYEVLTDTDKDNEKAESGNLFRYLACFTNNGEKQCRVFIRPVFDLYWNKTGDNWETESTDMWEFIGYLDEIPTFQHLLKAYRKYIEPQER